MRPRTSFLCVFVLMASCTESTHESGEQAGAGGASAGKVAASGRGGLNGGSAGTMGDSAGTAGIGGSAGAMGGSAGTAGIGGSAGAMGGSAGPGAGRGGSASGGGSTQMGGGGPGGSGGALGGTSGTCPDCVGTPADCADYPRACGAWAQGYCEAAIRYLKPKVAESATQCMVTEVTDCVALTPYNCMRRALAAAFPAQSADSLCDGAVVICEGSGQLLLHDECHVMLDGLNAAGLEAVRGCLLTDRCQQGLWECIEQLS